ncbi:hypothetical protein MKS88_000827 [Plasmodium brasilianum]|uniref:Uncharacterized protein n=1 Tax=Plasmodium brasilianum TaxID=5824 RepID=A0ACB9YFR0_PLABR|nr:hypothetical protein MKS88_000827 [Plasmodium brasilianum]
MFKIKRCNDMIFLSSKILIMNNLDTCLRKNNKIIVLKEAQKKTVFQNRLIIFRNKTEKKSIGLKDMLPTNRRNDSEKEDIGKIEYDGNMNLRITINQEFEKKN